MTTRPIALLLTLVALLVAPPALGATRSIWTARWLGPPGETSNVYGVHLFRRTLELPARPARFVVHVSADNRYQLFVNGILVARGPARGDLQHWRYETLDLAPRLRAGKNVLAAVVWNAGEQAPLAQVSHRTGFLVQGDTEAEQKLVDTGTAAWRHLRNEAYTALPMTSAMFKTFLVVGPGDRVQADRYPWGWQTIDFDDSGWKEPAKLERAASRTGRSSDANWLLTERSIPLMEERPERLAVVRRVSGPVRPPAAFPARPARWTVPANAQIELLLDQRYLTTTYPELIVSGGKGASITMAYAENLWTGKEGKDKGHRDQIDGKVFRGFWDEFLPDGGDRRLFAPLWWRTYRYVQLTIKTAEQPLTIEDLKATYTGYPFRRVAQWSSPSPELTRILDVGWRTARLCAHETYVDCPYYEQLQYTGDTRVQALVSLYMTGDDRLMRNAIEQFNDSRTGNDPTKSRHPAAGTQIIPPFSVLWIGMVHDHWRYRDDPAFVRRMLPGVRQVLGFFQQHQRPEGVLGPIPFWPFVDWVRKWQGGVPPGWNDRPPPWSNQAQPPPADPTKDPLGSSSVLDMHLLLALGWAADLEQELGEPALATSHRQAAERLRGVVQKLYWDEARGLFADTAKKQKHSQHANILAVLTDVVTGAQARAVMEKVMADAALEPASIYFRYYLNEALRKVGLGDGYLDQLGPWRRMLALGLTTWAETEDPSRSECHAWGASPNIELFRTVLGIDTAAPGFRKVRIAPALGTLPWASGRIPHPRGEIAVSAKMDKGRLTADVQLPAGVDGELVWRGQTRPLASGRSRVVINP